VLHCTKESLKLAVLWNSEQTSLSADLRQRSSS